LSAGVYVKKTKKKSESLTEFLRRGALQGKGVSSVAGKRKNFKGSRD